MNDIEDNKQSENSAESTSEPNKQELEMAKEEPIYFGKERIEKGIERESGGKPSDQIESLKKRLAEEENFDKKLELAISFMEESLSRENKPNFRDFWEARKLCLPLFKENVSPSLRTEYWSRYSELSKEARRLKDLLDEQSAFAVEQIEIAIQAIEQDLSHIDNPSQAIHFIDRHSFPAALKQNFEQYESLQKQLNHLNIFASQINGLRKELIKTEMRVRNKNRFFQALSALGDRVFPKRKELIKQISQQFTEDIDQFIKAHCGAEMQNESPYALREEIKALQGLAKVLTLNTQSFTQTRAQLSECWDKLKFEEKERRKERAEQRVVFQKNAEEIQQLIKDLAEEINQNRINIEEGQKRLEEISKQMRRVDLGREEVRNLREGLSNIRNQIQSLVKAKEEIRNQQERERVEQRKEFFNSLKRKAEELVHSQTHLNADELMIRRDSLLKEFQESSLSKLEKQELERLLKPLKDIITEKQEQALLSLSEDDRESLKQLQNVLQQRKERRLEIKNHVDSLRRSAGTSSLDQALDIANQINEEKERLEKANSGIQEIEQKIAELKKQLKS
jgi:hypothetical protein